MPNHAENNELLIKKKHLPLVESVTCKPKTANGYNPKEYHQRYQPTWHPSMIACIWAAIAEIFTASQTTGLLTSRLLYDLNKK